MLDSRGALAGVRVLDLADESGVYCGKLLADMGADVIKIEPPGGAAMRRIGPFHGGKDAGAPGSLNRSLFFWHYNTNKRSVTLDLHSATDRSRFARLVESADVLIETAAPGTLDALGCGFAVLADRNPGVTWVSITPFGQSGPYRDFRASDLVAQAVGGMVHVNGFPGEAPLQGLGLQAYHSAATYAAIGVLLALLARAVTGRGQWIDVSIQECVVASVEHASSFFHHDGTIAERQGSLHWTRYFRVGRCRDGYVMHCTLADWTSLIEWVKADGKAQDLAEPAWEDFNHRRDHCVHLFDVLDAWVSEYTVAELVENAQLRRIPYAPVLSPEDLRQNPQLAARDFFIRVRHDELGRAITYPGAPYVFSATPWKIRKRPPLIGEHNEDVFRESKGSRVRGVQGSRGPALGAQHSAFRALEGVRVIDFTWVVAGPVATRILADHGAEVIKIERRDALDFGSRRSGLTGNLNRGKRSIVIDMNTPRGLGLARQLITRSDIVADNFSARVMRNWGLDYDTLHRLKPDIIQLNMSGFGHTGPQQDYVSYGPTLQALAGYTLLMRHPGGEPAGWGFSYSDMAAGYSGALAVLMALWHRRRTGQGQRIDLSQFENITALLGPCLVEALAHQDGSTPCAAPVDNRSQEMPSAPHGVFRCTDEPGDGAAADRWCAVAIFGDDDWLRFRRALGSPEWTRDQRFATEAGRLRHAAELNAYVESWTRSRRAEDVMMHLQRAGIAAGVVANAADLCRRDPQLQARRYWIQLPTPDGEPVTLDGLPFTMSETPGRVEAPGPLLGEHTDEVLQGVLGLDNNTIAALRAERIVI